MKAPLYLPDSNTMNDPKCIVLIDQLGPEGYGIYCMLIELLREQTNLRLSVSLIPSIARRFNTSEGKIEAVIKNYDLFILKNDFYFFSTSLCRRMKEIQIMRSHTSEINRTKALKRWGKHAGALPQHSPGNADAYAGDAKESKVKEKKVNKIKVSKV